MRYLSQIARQTTSRFVPARRAGWQPTVPPMAPAMVPALAQPLVQEQAVERPAAADTEVENVAGADFTEKPVLTNAEPGHEGLSGSQQRSGPNHVDFEDEMPPSGETSLVAAPRRHLKEIGSPVARFRQEGAEAVDLAGAARPGAARRQPGRSAAAVPEGIYDAVTDTEQRLSARNELPPHRSQASATISTVFAELERRRLELELHDRREQRSAPRESETRDSIRGGLGSQETVRLDIGSIVVEVEPEPAPSPAQPPPRRVRPPREMGGNWSRSWLDR